MDRSVTGHQGASDDADDRRPVLGPTSPGGASAAVMCTEETRMPSKEIAATQGYQFHAFCSSILFKTLGTQYDFALLNRLLLLVENRNSY